MVNGLDRKFIFIQCKGICYYCGKKMDFRPAHNGDKQLPDDFTVDHKLPVALGGTNGLLNLAGCCNRCNVCKKNYTEEEFRNRFKNRLGQRKQENKKRSENGEAKKEKEG